MPRADAKLFELLTDEVGLELLDVLAADGRPKSQTDLASETGHHASTVSRRLTALEDAGLIARQGGSRGRYGLRYREATFDLLKQARDLAASALQGLAAEATEQSISFERIDDLDVPVEIADS